MLLPYSHEEALGQCAVPYLLHDGRMVDVYPLRQGDIMTFNAWLKRKWLYQFENQIPLLPESERPAFINGLLDQTENFSFEYGHGNDFFVKSAEALTAFVRILTRGNWDTADIQATFFPDDTVPEASLIIINEMRMCVHRELPPDPPPLALRRNRPEVHYTPEESAARIFKGLAKEFGWTYAQTLALTAYQTCWFLRLTPDERSSIEEMDRMSGEQENKFFKEPPVPPGAVRFDSPEAWEAYMAEQGKLWQENMNV